MEVTTHYGASNMHLIMLHGRNRDPETLKDLYDSLRTSLVGQSLNIHIPTGLFKLDQGYAWYRNHWLDKVSRGTMYQDMEFSEYAISVLVKERCCTKGAQIILFGHSQGGILLYDWLKDYERGFREDEFWNGVHGLVTYGATSMDPSKYHPHFKPIRMIHGSMDSNIPPPEYEYNLEVLPGERHEITTSNSHLIATKILDCFTFNYWKQ